MRRILPLLGLVPLLGCADMDIAMKGGDNELDDTGAPAGVLRFDVYPSDATPGLEAQSVELDPRNGWSDLEIELAPSVRLDGFVEAYLATPPAADVTVPGEDAPIPARVELLRTGTIAGGSTTTDGAGAFGLTVPPGQGYSLRILPEDTDQVPFEVREIPVLASDLDLGRIYLDYGAPVWGRVTHRDGTVPAGARVHLVDVLTGAEGPLASIDEDGWYLLRAYPGDYLLIAEGREGTSVPTLSTRLLFEGDEGLRQDVDVGPTATSTVEGFLVDAQGQSLAGVAVRATSASLRDVTGSLVVTDTSNEGGRFALDLLPGSWQVEIIPPYEGLLSPRLVEVEVGDAGQSMGDLVLDDRLQYSALVQDPEGDAVIDVLVTAREIGFDAYTWSTTTGPDGRIELLLPRTPVEITLSPPTGDLAITMLRIDPTDEANSLLTLVQGTALSGRLHSEGEPVPYALVEIRDEGNRLMATTISDAEGVFDLRVDAP